MKNKLDNIVKPYIEHIIELNSKLNLFTNEEELDKKTLFENGIVLLDLIEIKKALNKILLSKKKEYQFELQKEKIMFDSVMLDMFEFPYEYNEQQQVINGDDWRALFEKSSKISDKISFIEECIEYIDKKILISNITEEENNSLKIFNDYITSKKDSNDLLETEIKDDNDIEQKNLAFEVPRKLSLKERYEQLMQNNIYLIEYCENIV